MPLFGFVRYEADTTANKMPSRSSSEEIERSLMEAFGGAAQACEKPSASRNDDVSQVETISNAKEEEPASTKPFGNDDEGGKGEEDANSASTTKPMTSPSKEDGKNDSPVSTRRSSWTWSITGTTIMPTTEKSEQPRHADDDETSTTTQETTEGTASAASSSHDCGISLEGKPETSDGEHGHDESRGVEEEPDEPEEEPEMTAEEKLEAEVKRLQDRLAAAELRNYDLQVERNAQQQVIDELSDIVRSSMAAEDRASAKVTEEQKEKENAATAMVELQAHLSVLEGEKKAHVSEISYLRERMEDVDARSEAKDLKIQALECAVTTLKKTVQTLQQRSPPRHHPQYSSDPRQSPLGSTSCHYRFSMEDDHRHPQAPPERAPPAAGGGTAGGSTSGQAQRKAWWGGWMNGSGPEDNSIREETDAMSSGLLD